VFDEALADRAVRFFSKHLRHVKGEWANTPLDLADWQRDRVVRPIFGTLREDGRRQYRTVFVFIPRKNGKSTLAGGIALKLTFADHEPGAEVYSAAADRDQAGIVFGMARDMVELSPALMKRGKLFKRSITVPRTRSSYKVISSDAGTKHGFSPHGVVIDELHAIKGSFEGSVVEALTTGQGSRRQPLTVILTTAGFDRKSIAFREYTYACQVRDGVIDDPNYLPVIFELPKDADWRDRDAWRAANPNLGESLQMEYLEEKFIRADGSPADENSFKRLHLNEWTEQATRWIPLEAWNRCADPDLTPEMLEGRTCAAGLDLSTVDDISALVIAGELADGRVAIFPWFWIPAPTAAERTRKERVPYLKWIEEGRIEATEDNVVDYDVIRARVNDLAERFDIVDLGYDPWNATQLASQLTADGLPMTTFRQNFTSLAPPTEAFQRLWKSGRLVHTGCPVLRYQASNVAVKTNTDGFFKPARDISGDKIDGIVAAIMAVGRLIVSDPDIDDADEVIRV